VSPITTATETTPAVTAAPPPSPADRLAQARKLLARLRSDARRVEEEADALRSETVSPEAAADADAAAVETLLKGGTLAGSRKSRPRGDVRARLGELEAERSTLARALVRQAEAVERLEAEASYRRSAEARPGYVAAVAGLAEALEAVLARAEAVSAVFSAIRAEGLRPSPVPLPVEHLLAPALLADLREAMRRARELAAERKDR